MFFSDIYAYWRMRKRQLIIGNILGAVVAFFIVNSGRAESMSRPEKITVFVVFWLILSWVMGAMIAVLFSNDSCDDRIISIIHGIGQSIMGTFGALMSHGSFIFIFMLFWGFAKAAIGLAIILVLCVVSIITYPFTTVIAFVRTRHPE